ncbi:MAG: TIGR04083 family peptide-modifying radical SAM enzyme, partial [Planctomycetes bacterium]|nr:TIGR04083 family peptide-modifying radical SAM enzyme [Planctomycetota bacterium]
IWRQALEGLRQRFGHGRYDVALQSNLWLLDDEFCQLFREHKVDIGSSLDGPEEITDQQRGKGYFTQTMKGIRLARSSGLNVGCIATFTPWSAQRWRDVFDFFLEQRLGMSIHASVPSLECGDLSYVITPEQYGDLLSEALDYYVEHRREISVSSLDQMCRAVGCREGKVCTFRDCLGMFLAIDPHGNVYPCQRFCGRPDYRLGNVADSPTFAGLMASPVAKRMQDRQKAVRLACEGCDHLDICKGGCPYNAWAAGNGENVKDPYCDAYRRTFGHITRRILNEMASEENIEAIAAKPYDGRGNPLLQKGPLIELVREGPHPSRVARSAKRIVAAVELARGPDLDAVAARLVALAICRSQRSALASLARLKRRLEPRPGVLNNLYLHVTFNCQLNCTHCYARADAHGLQGRDMPVEAVARLIRQAKDVGFRQVVITGGEPLVHTQRDQLLATFRQARSWAAPMNLVARTNLAMLLSDEELCQVSLAFDQVVVSVDGNQETHDARRGTGSYAAAVTNLESYVELAARPRQAGELSLAAVMRSADIQGEPGGAVRDLAARLGIRRVRFRPLLPLGRAADWHEPPTSEALGAHADPLELIEGGFHPVASCGLGQNLYVEPSGNSFPCYAYHKPHSYLGNVIETGLESVLESADFQDLCCHNVDSNSKCRACEVRYLCSGACRAWGGAGTQFDLDAPPPDCTGLQRRASGLLDAASQFLGVGHFHEVPSCHH